jgi:LAO/AO transport system kinase
MSPGAASETPEAYCDGVRSGDRRALARTITLLENTRPDRVALAQRVLEELVPYTGSAQRVGITGPPGVGKSALIETLGLYLIRQGHRVAVLAVDPSSPVTGGSILGDKTRMERLAQEDAAYIRPSPSGGSLGGVAQRTREAMLVCEAAGFDVVLIETVGIGQSEVTVASMVDFFLVLLQPGAGDELQGIKKGVLELADALVVNKADGEQADAAERARAEYAQALDLLRPPSPRGRPPVLAASAHTGQGIEALWQAVCEHREALERSGARQARRRDQARAWLWSLVEQGLLAAFRDHPVVAAGMEQAERDVESLKTTPAAAARALLESFRQG